MNKDLSRKTKGRNYTFHFRLKRNRSLSTQSTPIGRGACQAQRGNLLRRGKTALSLLFLLLSSFTANVFAADLVKADPELVGFSAVELKKIDSVMQSYIDSKRLADIDVLIARKGKIVYNQSFTKDKAKGKGHALYRIASMTKPITSVAIMMLVEQGKLSLDAPVSRYIPEFKNPKILVENIEKSESSTEPYRLENTGREITVKDLLTHTSGIIYGFMKVKHLSQLYYTNSVSDGLTTSTDLIEDNVKKIAKMPLKHQPGKHFTYGLSTDVLGYLVEVVSQKTLQEFFEENIFIPLKMDDTRFYLSEEQFARLVPLYTPTKDGGIRVIDEEKDKSNLITRFKNTGKQTYFSGGAGLVSSANDYAVFLQMMINKGEYQGVQILKKETVALMFENHIDKVEQGDGNYRFGLGFMISNKPNKKTVIPEGSLSWGGIFHTKFWIDPTNDIIAVSMAQKFPAEKSDVHVKFKQLVYDALKN